MSNIAWSSDEEEEARDLLASFGLSTVEVAPGHWFPDPEQATPARAREIRGWWARKKLQVVSLQALLQGVPDVRFFGLPDLRRRAVRHLRAVISIGAEMGAGVLVLGAPAARRLEGRSPEEAWKIALETFHDLGEHAANHGTCLCLEPNARGYGCEFVTRSAEARRLVEEIASPGFGLHLDLSTMTMEGEDVAAEIAASAPFLRHFHVSSPGLESVATVSEDLLETVLQALREAKYEGAVSLEMRAGPLGTNVGRAREALQKVVGTWRAMG